MNYENVEIQDLESSIETWMLSDPYDAAETFGEDVISAVTEALDHD
jgi:hypothetical protein